MKGLPLNIRARNFLHGEMYRAGKIPENHSLWNDSKWMPDPKFVSKMTSRELMEQANFGRKSLAEVILWLDEYGLNLADNPGDPLKPRQRCPHCGQLMRPKMKAASLL